MRCSAGSPLFCHLGRLSHLGGQAWTHSRRALRVRCAGGPPTWPVMTLMPFFTLWLCESLHIAHVSHSICRRLTLRSPKVYLGLWAEEKAGPRCEPEACPLCYSSAVTVCAHSSSAYTPKSGPFLALCLLLFLPQHFRLTSSLVLWVPIPVTLPPLSKELNNSFMSSLKISCALKSSIYAFLVVVLLKKLVLTYLYFYSTTVS